MSIALVRRALALLALASLAPCAHAQFVSYTGTPQPPQSFDTLAASGTSTTLPNGWYLDDPDDAYLADDGSAASGNGYSHGTASTTERALGSIASNSTASVVFGVQLQNDTGATLATLDLGFRVELWRRGDATADRTLFAYSTDATSLATGTWTPVSTFDLVAPTTAGSPGPRDGNAAGNFANVASTLTGLAIAPGAKLWLRWSDGNSSGADDGLAVDEVRFGPAGDFPPTVATTTPTNNATGVAATTNVTIVFSEPVNATGAWYSISCATSGAHPALTTGGPQSFVLDPTTNFTPGEQCTVTIVAAQVVDLDGTADAMAANYVFAFTIAPDLAPTVASTVPANGAAAVAVASNVTITFSEDVTVAGNWYAITCANSGAHPAAASGGPRTFTLNPDADFALGESCTVTITAANVSDQDGNPDQLAANYSFTFQVAQSAGDYYANVDTNTPESMRATLHATIDDHDAATYFEAWTTLEIADQDPLNTGRILDVYRNRTYTKEVCRSGAPAAGCPTGAANRYNREHTWPNSHGFNDLDGLDANNNPYSPYTDTHMLYLSAEDYNSNRGNKYYANCPGCAENQTDAYGGFGGGTGTYPGNSNWSGAASYEVWNHRKGDMARAIFYMDVRYEGGAHANGQPEPDLRVTDDPSLADDTTPGGVVASVGYMGLLSVLVEWHNADPPDAQEQARNDVVYSFQGNRNPFIDHPEWVACLYGGIVTICPSQPQDALFQNGFE